MLHDWPAEELGGVSNGSFLIEMYRQGRVGAVVLYHCDILTKACHKHFIKIVENRCSVQIG